MHTPDGSLLPQIAPPVWSNGESGSRVVFSSVCQVTAFFPVTDKYRDMPHDEPSFKMTHLNTFIIFDYEVKYKNSN